MEPNFSSVNEYLPFADCDENLRVHVVSDYDGSSFCGVPVIAEEAVFSQDKTVLLRCSMFLVTYTIPDTVTCIASHAFRYCVSLTSVSIPNSITSTVNEAFSGCVCLWSVSIDSVHCVSNFKNIFPAYAPVTHVVIGSSVTVIGESAFSGCSNLTNVTVPNSVTCIEASAFAGCRGLFSVTLAENVTIIRDSAFSGCSNSKQ